ncbi:MAG: hypothetical protein WCK86_10200 [Planctomycetia bacterium]
MLGLSAAAPDRELSLRRLHLTAMQALSPSPNRTQYAPSDYTLKKSANHCPAETPTAEVALSEKYPRTINSQH